MIDWYQVHYWVNEKNMLFCGSVYCGMLRFAPCISELFGTSDDLRE